MSLTLNLKKAVLWLSALFCALIALAVYSYTLTPNMPTTDGGELITAAWLPGIAHAPGFPLWTILGWLFAHLLKFGDIIFRLNWFSAFLGSTTVLVVFWLLWNNCSEEQGFRQKLLLTLTVVLCFVFSRTFWSWSTVVEVYALQVFLLALLFFFLFRWQAKNQLLDLVFAAFIYGLGLTNHHVSFVLLAPAIAYLLWSNKQQMTLKKIIYSSIALGCGLAVYLYLPIRAAQAPLLNWGDPSSLERFWWHISGKQFQVNLFGGGLTGFIRQFFEGIWLWLNQYSLFLSPLWLMGAYQSWKKDKKLTIFFLLIIVFFMIYVAVYQIAEDRDAYYLPAFFGTIFWLYAGLAWLFEHSKIKTFKYLLILLPILVFWWNLPYAGHRDYTYAQDYLHNVLDSIPQNSVILTGDWQLYSPLLAKQIVLGEYKNILAIDLLLFQNRSWYFKQMQKRYPELYAQIEPEAKEFLKSLAVFESGKLISGDNMIMVRYQMLLKTLMKNISSRPVYITADLLNHFAQFKLDFSNQIRPEGLLFRLNPEKNSKLPEINWELNNLRRAIKKKNTLDLATKKILHYHALAAYIRGLYLKDKGQNNEAEYYFKLSKELDPKLIKFQ